MCADRPKRYAHAERFADAARVVTFGCELPVATTAYAQDRWDDLPMVSDGFERARDAILVRVKQLIDALGASERPRVR